MLVQGVKKGYITPLNDEMILREDHVIPEALAHLAQPFSFAVISDTHFVTRDFLGQNVDVTRPLDIGAYVENVTYSLAPMMDALRTLKPDFLVLTGDVAEPPPDLEDHRKDLQAALDFFATCDIPMLIVRGNSDGEGIFDDVVLPCTELFLGHAPEVHYFSFEIGKSQFIVLDTSFWCQDQCHWLEDILYSRSQDIVERTFIFGHHPVWAIARPFFSDRDFQSDMVSLLSRHAVDAYFCGHTHNQNIVLHRTAGLPVLQCMGALIGVSDEPPLPLNQIQSLLPLPDDTVTIWPGYLENTAPGWFMTYVNQGTATVEWHHLNRGAEAVVSWYRPGDVHKFWFMEQIPGVKLVETDVRRIRRAFLRFCAWDNMAGARVVLNGVEIGALPVADNFSPGRMDVPPGALASLQMENRVHIEPVDGCEGALGNLVLEVVLPGGRHVRTQILEDIYAWSDQWDVWGLDTVQKMKDGMPLTTVLSFR